MKLRKSMWPSFGDVPRCHSQKSARQGSLGMRSSASQIISIDPHRVEARLNPSNSIWENDLDDLRIPRASLLGIVRIHYSETRGEIGCFEFDFGGPMCGI